MTLQLVEIGDAVYAVTASADEVDEIEYGPEVFPAGWTARGTVQGPMTLDAALKAARAGNGDR